MLRFASLFSRYPVFHNSRKTAQQTAQRLISGHFALIAWWALKHAGVFQAILNMEETGQGLDPLVHATCANMSPDVLGALIDYLATTGLIALKDKQARLTTEGAHCSIMKMACWN